MKTDARVRYTKMIIKDTFLKLLKKKSVDKITVTELCKAADINRATFYTHYEDCYDLLRSIEDEFINQFKQTGKKEKLCDPKELITSIYDVLDDNRELCNVLIFESKHPTMINRLMDTARDYSKDKWNKTMPDLSDEEQEMLFNYLATGLSALIYNNYKTQDRNKTINLMVELITKF